MDIGYNNMLSSINNEFIYQNSGNFYWVRFFLNHFRTSGSQDKENYINLLSY